MSEPRVAKEAIWEKDDQGVDRLVVAKGHLIPDGVEVPKGKTEAAGGPEQPPAAPVEEKKVDQPAENKARTARKGK